MLLIIVLTTEYTEKSTKDIEFYYLILKFKGKAILSNQGLRFLCIYTRCKSLWLKTNFPICTSLKQFSI
jgi:hypothetical protein